MTFWKYNLCSSVFYVKFKHILQTPPCGFLKIFHDAARLNKVIFNETHFGKAYGKNPLNSLLPLLLPFHHILSEETSARSTPNSTVVSSHTVGLNNIQIVQGNLSLKQILQE